MTKFKPGEVVVLDAPDDDPLSRANGQSVTIDRVVIEMTTTETEITYYFKAFYKGPGASCVTPEHYLVKPPERMLVYSAANEEPGPIEYDPPRRGIYLSEEDAMELAIRNARGD